MKIAKILGPLFIFTTATVVGFASSKPAPKTIGNDWTWFEDYAFAYATYTVACEPNRRCQVGTGVFGFGAPRGEKIRFTDELEITVIGFGAIHMRVVDGKGQAKASFVPGSRKGFTKTFTW